MEDKRVEKNITPVVTNPVTTKKKSVATKLAETFVADDVSNVKDYILFDVLIPGIKDTISTIFHNSLDMIMFGSSKNRSRSASTNSRTSYTRYYDERNYRRDDRDRDRVNYSSRRCDIDEIIFRTKREAEEVLFEMQELYDRFRNVSIADLYQLIDKPVDSRNWTLNDYGWEDLSSVDVIRVPDGYLLRLPRPKSIK